MDKKTQKDIRSIVRSEPNLTITTTLGALARSWDLSPEEMGFHEDTALGEVVRLERVARHGDWAILLDATDHLVNNVGDEGVFALDEYQIPST